MSATELASPHSVHANGHAPRDANGTPLPDPFTVTPPAPVAPPTELSETDLLRLSLATERVQRTAAQLQIIARQHADVKTDHDRFQAALGAVSDDLRVRYDLTGNARVDMETGAIVRP